MTAAAGTGGAAGGRAWSMEGRLAWRLLVVVAIYGVGRAAFLLVNGGIFRAEPPGEIAWAFVRGLRFDLVAITYTNIPFILLSLAPVALQQRDWFQRLLGPVYVVGNSACALVMVGDLEYFRFTGTRLTSEVFALRREALQQTDQLVVHYLPHVLLWLAITAALIAAWRHSARPPIRPRGWARAAATTLLVLLFGVVATRGGLQRKPLRPIHAFPHGNHELGLLTLNPVFTLVRSPDDRQVEPVAYFRTDAEAAAILAAPFGVHARPATRQNIVLIILESFATELWGAAGSTAGLTPFLDSLAARGAFLPNNFANGRRSLDALPSILLGLPHLMERSIARSAYEGNEWVGLGHLMERAGYHTSMFHGAEKGTMYFDAIAGMAGVRDFYPLERYPADRRARDFDGHWGIYDEPFLQFAVEELGRHRRPFFSTLFTISTHQPYRVPPKYLDSLPEGAQEIHQSMRYTDLSLRRFFEAAGRQPWFGETLFIITGDHTQSDRSARYDTPLGRFMVPLLLYHPGHPLPPIDEERVTQHADILPTILDYAGVEPGRIPRHGRSAFSASPGEAVLRANDAFWLVRREGVVERAPDGAERLFPYRGPDTGTGAGLEEPALQRTLATELHAHMQHFANSLVHNSFYRDGPAARVELGTGAVR